MTLPTASLVGLLFAYAPQANAHLTSLQATTAIVGEAAASPFAVKLAVAHALKNRGSLRGVYGLTAAHNHHEPAATWAEARRAWRLAATTPDNTNGATHFGNAHDVATGIFYGLEPTAVIGTGNNATYFFK